MGRRFLGGIIPFRDADGSIRMAAEGNWIEVVYSGLDVRLVRIETVESAPAVREFKVVARGRYGDVLSVGGVHLETAVGVFRWRADATTEIDAGADYREGTPRRPGFLTLPDGRTIRTTPGTGVFDAKGWVRGYYAWRDADVTQGWSLITEVDPSTPDEWTPLIAAFPLLLFTRAPNA